MSYIAWDLERFEDVKSAVQKCYDELDSLKNHIEFLKSEVNDNWSSSAGAEYSARMEDDIKKISDMLVSLEKLKGWVIDAQTEYDLTESKVRSKISTTAAILATNMVS